jgi:two-component system response regulator RegX3
MGNRILLIGCNGYQQELRQQGGADLFAVHAVAELRDHELLTELAQADLIVLHQSAVPRDLPEITAHLRGHTNRPLLVVLDPFAEAAVTAVLEAGADDALPAHVTARELHARIRAHLRRDREYAATHLPAAYEVGDLRMDVGRHEVVVRGRPVDLTPREFELLEHLARYAGRPVRRNELLEEVWGYNSEMTTRTLDVHVGRLRQKIEHDAHEPRMIVTVPGVGYKLTTA